MRFSIPAGELSKALTAAVSAIDRRPHLAILGGCLVTADAGTDTVTIAATNIDTWARASAVGADVGASGRVVIADARGFLRAVKSADSKSAVLELEAIAEGLRLAPRLEGSGVVQTFPTVPTEDFPRFPTIDRTGYRLRVPSWSLRASFERVRPAVSRDDTRPMLCSVHVDIAGDTVTMVGTDSYRLSVSTLTGASTVDAPTDARVNLDARFVDLACKHSKRVGAVTFHVDCARTFATVGGLELVGRNTEGQFPDWRRLFPGAGAIEGRVTVSAPAILPVLERADSIRSECLRIPRVAGRGDRVGFNLVAHLLAIRYTATVLQTERGETVTRTQHERTLKRLGQTRARIARQASENREQLRVALLEASQGEGALSGPEIARLTGMTHQAVYKILGKEV